MALDHNSPQDATLESELGEQPTNQTFDLMFSQEAHLARALFRRGADDARHCTFSEGFIDPPEYEGFVQSLLYDTSPEEQYSKVNGPAQMPNKLPLYRPLLGSTAIRLLALKPGPPGSLIQCSLLYFDRMSQSLPAYEAISYAWGVPSDTLEISCHGHVVQITRSLCAMLERIRCPDQVRYVWADALCINQKDPQELSQQVSIMRDIYRSAHRVLVWLGHDLQLKAHEAFALCCTIVERWRIPPDKPIVDGFAEYTGMISTANEGELDRFPSVSAKVWDALALLFNLPWFR